MRTLLILLLLCGTAWAEQTANLVNVGEIGNENAVYFQVCVEEETGRDTLNDFRCEKILSTPARLRQDDPLTLTFVRDVRLTWPTGVGEFRISKGTKITFGPLDEGKR